MNKIISLSLALFFVSCTDREATGAVATSTTTSPSNDVQQIVINSPDAKQQTDSSSSNTIASSSSENTGTSSLNSSDLQLKILSWQGDAIPLQYACVAKGGENIFPDISWKFTSSEVISYAFFVEDESISCDGISCVHWNLLNISPETQGLDQAKTYLKNGVLQGLNYENNFGWAGPCPSSGTHIYSFTLYAMSVKVEGSIQNKSQLEKKYKSSILKQESIQTKF